MLRSYIHRFVNQTKDAQFLNWNLLKLPKTSTVLCEYIRPEDKLLIAILNDVVYGICWRNSMNIMADSKFYDMIFKYYRALIKNMVKNAYYKTWDQCIEALVSKIAEYIADYMISNSPHQLIKEFEDIMEYLLVKYNMVFCPNPSSNWAKISANALSAMRKCLDSMSGGIDFKIEEEVPDFIPENNEKDEEEEKPVMPTPKKEITTVNVLPMVYT